MWGDRERIEEEVTTQQILQGDKRSWKLITVHGNKYTGMAPAWCHRILNSSAYHITIIIVTIANALVICTIRFKHTSDQKPREYFFQDQRTLEIYFTAFYDLEVFFKIFCLSFNGYIKRTIHKMELLLAVTSTIHVLPIPGMFLSFPFSFFMVLRILRLIKASPMLEAFVYKVRL